MLSVGAGAHTHTHTKQLVYIQVGEHSVNISHWIICIPTGAAATEATAAIEATDATEATDAATEALRTLT